jgi:hypothetical protein
MENDEPMEEIGYAFAERTEIFSFSSKILIEFEM